MSRAQHEASQAAQVEHHVARELAHPATIAKLHARGLRPEDVRHDVTQRTLARMRGEPAPRTGPERFGPEDPTQFTSRTPPSPGSPERFGPEDPTQFTTQTRGRGKQRFGGLPFGERQPGEGRMPFAGRFSDREHTPLSDAEYQAHTANVEATVKKAIADGQATDHKYGIDVAAGKWQPQRAEVHRRLVDDIYNRQAATAGSDGRALIMGGLGGAGKSTVLKNHLGLDSKDWVTINPDDVKEAMAEQGLVPNIPGLSPMEASALIHEESSHIANLIAERALADHKNLIYDITMSSKGSVQKRLDKLKAHGYQKPEAVFVDIPVETSVERALGRHRSGMEQYRQGQGLGGRYVPPSVIRANNSSTSNSANRDVFDALMPQFGSSRVFDTSGQGAREVPLSGRQGQESITNAANPNPR